MMKGRGLDGGLGCGKEGAAQQSRKIQVEPLDLTSAGGVDEEPPPPIVRKYWGNFSVTNENIIEGLTAASVERAFRNILLWTPKGGGNPIGAALFGSKLRAFDTPRGGDSLLHALSISALGCTDFDENLRRELRILLHDKSKKSTLLEAFHQGRLRQDMGCCSDFEIAPSDFLTSLEYQGIKLTGTTSNAYLSAFHIFLMANVLRRPIIVYGEKRPDGDDRDSGIPGVYLPTLFPEWSCTKNPLAVVYSLSSRGTDHFTGLVGTEHGLRRLPLFYSDGEDLPIRFGVPAASPKPLAGNNEFFTYLKVSVHRSQQSAGPRLLKMAEILETPLSPRVSFAPPVVPRRPGVANGADRRRPASGQRRNGDQRESSAPPRRPSPHPCGLRPEDFPALQMSPTPSDRPKKERDHGCGIMLRRLFRVLRGPRISRRKSARIKPHIRSECTTTTVSPGSVP